MEIVGHEIYYKLYGKGKKNITNKIKKNIFEQIYKKHLHFGLLYGEKGKVIGKWSYDDLI